MSSQYSVMESLRASVADGHLQNRINDEAHRTRVRAFDSARSHACVAAVVLCVLIWLELQCLRPGRHPDAPYVLADLHWPI